MIKITGANTKLPTFTTEISKPVLKIHIQPFCLDRDTLKREVEHVLIIVIVPPDYHC